MEGLTALLPTPVSWRTENLGFPIKNDPWIKERVPGFVEKGRWDRGDISSVKNQVHIIIILFNESHQVLEFHVNYQIRMLLSYIMGGSGCGVTDCLVICRCERNLAVFISLRRRAFTCGHITVLATQGNDVVADSWTQLANWWHQFSELNHSHKNFE